MSWTALFSRRLTFAGYIDDRSLRQYFLWSLHIVSHMAVARKASHGGFLHVLLLPTLFSIS